MKFPLYIAKRYLFSKSGNNAINIITIISAIGVVVGTIALFIVLSVFSGLKEFSLDLIHAADPDLKISAVEGKSFEFTEDIERVLENSAIVSYSKVIEERALFSFNEKQHIASIKGVDNKYLTVNDLDSAIYVGEWLDEELLQSAVIGIGVSSALSLSPYDFIEPLKVFVPKPGKGYMTNLKKSFTQLNLQPLGIFQLNIEELDNRYVFTHLNYAQSLLNYGPNKISALELKLSPTADEGDLIEFLNINLGSAFRVQTRSQLNAVFHRMLNTENFVSYLVFTLIIIIALFNVVGAIVMMILDKKENLNTLYNLGTPLKEIKKIFVYQGFLLSLMGLVIGLIMAVTIVLVQKKFGFFMITPALPYPVEFKFANVLVVFITIITLGYLAAKIASSRISSKLIQLQ